MIYIVIIIILVAGVAAYFYVQNHAFSSMIWKEVQEIAEGSPVVPEPQRELSSLPAPLRRYLVYAVPGGRSPAGFARLWHGGTFRLKPDGDWYAIRAQEYFLCSAPAFIWTAVVKPNPLVWIRARDKYVRQQGNMLIKLRGALTLGDSRGKEMDVSSLLRYLSEMPWFPTAFLTVPGLVFEHVDAETFAVTISDGPHSAMGRFSVNNTGEITSFFSADRYREVEGKQVRTPWKGSYAEYREVDGMRVPHAVEVFWEQPEGDFSYARFRIEEMQYDIPASF